MTTTVHDHALSVEHIEQFEQQGFLILRNVVPADVRQRVQVIFEGVVDRLAKTWHEEGLVSGTFDDLPFDKRFGALRAELPARFPTSWRKALVSPAVYELWQRPELLGPIRSLLGDEVYAHGVWNGRPREPYTSVQKILWHQDAHYYKGWDSGDGKLISMWMPLVPVEAKSGCLQMLEGSHTRGYIDRIRGFNGLFTVDEKELEGQPIVTAAMNPGDALLFTDLTLHQALPNEADFVRWSIDIRFGSATPAIIDKTPRGYYCHSAEDPTRVEGFQTWQARYNYDEIGLEAELEGLEDNPITDLDQAARDLHVSRSELEVF